MRLAGCTIVAAITVLLVSAFLSHPETVRNEQRTMKWYHRVSDWLWKRGR